jgi:threonylcarbamoyladenosine tRNA methylthiotransferase MtaB
MTKRKPRVAVTTLGCKVNQFESASFISSLEEREAEIVPFSHRADIYIINSCAVTARAGAESRRMVRRAYKNNPEARVLVTGCYAQVAGASLLDLVDQPVCVVGNAFKHELVDFALARDFCDIEMYMTDISRVKKICNLPVRRFRGRTRAYLKIQDGCNNFCTYCIVPYARGRSRSLALKDALIQTEIFAAQGYREIVLTGIHLGKYGLDLEPSLDLSTLLQQLVADNPSIRFRLGSLEPGEISNDLLDLVADSPNLMPHLHLPLQSGDDMILKKMNRTYQVADYRHMVELISRRLPDAAVGADVLVGFPGEDEQAFGNTLNLLTDLPLAYLHVFPYSRRPATFAAGMKNQVNGNIKEKRVAILRALDKKKRTAFYQRFIGTERSVLAENRKNRFKLMRGFTDNYMPVYFPAPAADINQIVKVRLKRLDKDNNLFGKVIT